jgi:hypothetical protein
MAIQSLACKPPMAVATHLAVYVSKKEAHLLQDDLWTHVPKMDKELPICSRAFRVHGWEGLLCNLAKEGRCFSASTH